MSYSPFSSGASQPFRKPAPAPRATAARMAEKVDLSTLNAAQHEAATTTSGPLLVLAGAGTGKTRVITYRMAELVRRGVPAERILSVTFTNKAAKEMLERTQVLLGRRLKVRPLISTFHSFCVGVLRQEITALGYPDTFTIYDRGDQESTARKALREIKLPETSLRPSDLVNRISRWKMQGVTPQVARDTIETDHDLLAASAYRRYQNSLRAAGAVDLDDLLMLTAELFDQFPEVLERQQNRFEHVQIDEYQDTNEIQFQLIARLVRPHQNLCVVGDDDQSIYGWRGAEVKHILGFQNVFPNAKIIRLEDNYRCSDAILTLANQLVAHNRGRHEKRLIAHKTGTAVAIRDYPDENAEAEGVVRDINYLVTQLAVPLGEFAILFRTNDQPRLFEAELRRLRLRYVLQGGQSFFDRKEVKDLEAFLRLLVNPTDEQALLRIINVPPRGIGETSVTRVLQRAVQTGTTFWEAFETALTAKEVSSKVHTAATAFRSQLDHFRGRLRGKTESLATVVHDFIATIKYESAVEQQYSTADQQTMRLSIVEEFVRSVSEYEQRAERPALVDFLSEIAVSGFESTADETLQADSLKLMTLHSAKGLEFPRVYLVGLEQGILPHQRTLDSGNPEEIEEERRLCYVGITRARDFLTITRSNTRTKWGKRRESKPSIFLEQMHVPLPERPSPEPREPGDG